MKIAIISIILLTLTSCRTDRDENSDQGKSVIVEVGLKIATAPHKFDMYRPDSVDKVVVFLHGGGGTKESFAYQIGVKTNPGTFGYGVANGQALIENRAIVVFPQGLSVPTNPGARTWSNYAMTSGADDVQFIRDLVAYLADRFKIGEFYVVGHSMGGTMVSRIWCEAPELFTGFVSISGPPSKYFLSVPCEPDTAKPFLSIVGAQDNVLQNSVWDAKTWAIDPTLVRRSGAAFLDPTIIGERYFFSVRVDLSCGELVQDGDVNAVKDGRTATWTACDGKIQMIRVESSGHSVGSLQDGLTPGLLNVIFGFINGL